RQDHLAGARSGPPPREPVQQARPRPPLPRGCRPPRAQAPAHRRGRQPRWHGRGPRRRLGQGDRRLRPQLEGAGVLRPRPADLTIGCSDILRDKDTPRITVDLGPRDKATINGSDAVLAAVAAAAWQRAGYRQEWPTDRGGPR